MRLFIGVWVRNDLHQQLTELLEYYQGQHPQLNWTLTNKLHMTLLFLGETDSKHLELIKKQLHYIAQQTSVMLAECHQPCLLPSEDKPKVWGYQLKLQPNLMQLHHYLHQALLPNKDLQPNSFRPHITLARQPKTVDQGYQDLSQINFDPPTPTAPLIIDHISLIASELTQEGSHYRCLAEYKLSR